MSLLPKISTATIANGAALSGAVFLGEGVLCALQMPAAWDAAGITFQVSDDNGTTWKELMDDTGAAISITTPAAGNRLSLAAGLFASAPLIKVRSGTSGSPVNQSAARTITLIARKFYPRG